MATGKGSSGSKATGKAGGGSNAATAKTGGSTPKAGGGSGSGSGGTKVGGSGPTRTTTAVVGKKTVRKCYGSDGWEIKCPKSTMSKRTGIIVGSIIGAIVLIVAVLVLYKKWKIRKARQAGGDEEAVDEAETPEEKAGDDDSRPASPIGNDSAAPGPGYQPSPNGYVPPASSYMPVGAYQPATGTFETPPNQNAFQAPSEPQTREADTGEYGATPAPATTTDTSPLSGFQPAQPASTETPGLQYSAPSTEPPSFQPSAAEYPSGFQPNAPAAAVSSDPTPSSFQPGGR